MASSKDTSRARARRLFWEHNQKHDYACPDCGRSRSQLRNSFEVHHKDGDPTNNSMENLTALCRPCHNIREGKKPSINDYQHLLSQENGDNVQEIPLIRNTEQENKHFRRCDEASVPVLEIIQKNRRKYASVQIDFTSTGGWQKFKVIESERNRDGSYQYEEQKHVREPHAQLREPAVLSINKIASEFKGSKQPNNHNVSFRTNHGFDFTRFPPMTVDVSRELAERIRPVVMDKSNWEARAFDSRGYAPIY